MATMIEVREAKAKEIDERRETILEYIKENSPKKIKREELASIFGNISPKTITLDLTYLRALHPELESTTQGVRWIDKKEEIKKVAAPILPKIPANIATEVTLSVFNSKTQSNKTKALLEAEKTMLKDRYSFNKNDEGYNDPTAAAVIKSCDDIYGPKKKGEVWTVSSANGSVEQYLVMCDFKECASCLMLYTNQELYNPLFCVVIDFKTKSFVDVRRTCPKPTKYFLQFEFDCVNFEAVQRKLSSVFGLPAIEKTVEVVREVPVEKIVEVEKEVIKEVPAENTIEPVEIALLRQRAEIYEKCFTMLCQAGGAAE